ncbi:MAG: DUF357 domain-containing protein [Candidatus Bathyarchaeia archaeon]
MEEVNERLKRYVHTLERVFAEISLITEPLTIRGNEVKAVYDEAKRYYEDAKYFQEKKDYVTGLVAIVYSEGLLDALRLLGFAKFSWPTREKQKV